MGKIKYNVGDYLGPRKIYFIREDEPLIDKGGHKRRKGIFQCPFCENNFLSLIKNIVNGQTQSCGCLQKKATKEYNETVFKDIKNQTFGKLIVLEKTEERSGSSIIWKCQCECGAIVKVSSQALVSGKTLSCGCLKSKGEFFVGSFLTQNNINFEREKIFLDCKNPKTNRPLRFDFYLPDYHCCIEYDGIQHFEKTDFKNNSLSENQYRDNIKNQYCINNNIKLIRIPYYKQNQISQILCQELGI